MLQALDDEGLSDSTIVVLWGDHGWHLGDSQLWGKHTPFERAVHSPLMIRVPGMNTAGQTCEAPTETTDIYPTLVNLCKPAFARTRFPLDGKNLAPVLDGSRSRVREAALSYWQDAISVRTDTHRLIVRQTETGYSNTELYNIRHSPDPVKNLASSNPARVRRLMQHLPGQRTQSR